MPDSITNLIKPLGYVITVKNTAVTSEQTSTPVQTPVERTVPVKSTPVETGASAASSTTQAPVIGVQQVHAGKGVCKHGYEQCKQCNVGC